MSPLIELVSKVNWLHTSLFVTTTFLAIYTILFVPLTTSTFKFTVLYYLWTGLGITAGYHRYWCHRAYEATMPLRVFLMLGASGAVEGSCLWWSKRHRAHHRFTDTEKDPYGAHLGLFWSHIGWMLVKENKEKQGQVNINDLTNDWLVMLQHKYFGLFAIFFSAILPSVIAGLGWDDYKGGFFYAGMARLVVVHHATFCVNSLAHHLGERPFDDRLTPRNHAVTALLTLGEGYHNFHHEFPNGKLLFPMLPLKMVTKTGLDYRNGIRFYHYDPTKWLIQFCRFLGLAYDLRTFPENEITKGQFNMKSKILEEERNTICWPTPLDKLPEIDDNQGKASFVHIPDSSLTLAFEFLVKDLVSKEGKKLVICNNIVYDVENFIQEHPGGPDILLSHLGKDIGEAINGKVYYHSNAARNRLEMMRFANYLSSVK